MATQQDIAKMMAKLSAAFTSWKPNQFTNQIYFEDLQDIPTDELEEAARICRKQFGREFAPSIGELREAWQEYRETRPMNVNKFKKLEGAKPVYVTMPQECRDELNAFFKKKGIQTKYRALLEDEANRLMEAK